MSWDDNSLWCTADVEETSKSGSDGGDILGSDAKGGCGETDLGDEVGYFGVVEGHEFVDGVLGGLTVVGWVSVVSLGGAAEEGAEVFVEVGEETSVHEVSTSFLHTKDKNGG